jgi:hypothetical protein
VREEYAELSGGAIEKRVHTEANRRQSRKKNRGKIEF